MPLPGSDPFGEQVTAVPFSFDNPDALARTIEGATTFYNTYWIRFPHGAITFERAVENSKTLMQAAKLAGVRRFVHISITNTAQGRDLPYFRGKMEVEQALMESGLSYAIIRPTLVFGPGDIRMAHADNESVAVSDLEIAMKILAVTALRFCGCEDD